MLLFVRALSCDISGLSVPLGSFALAVALARPPAPVHFASCHVHLAGEDCTQYIPTVPTVRCRLSMHASGWSSALVGIIPVASAELGPASHLVKIEPPRQTDREADGVRQTTCVRGRTAQDGMTTLS